MDINKMLEIAKEELISSGKIVPKAFAVTNKNEITMILMPFRDDEEKCRTQEGLQEFIKGLGSKEYYIVHEVWVAKQKQDRIMTRAKRNIDREEAIMVTKFTPERSEMVIAIFKKDEDNTIIFDDVTTTPTEIGSNFWDVWGDQGKGIEKHFNEHNKRIMQNMMKVLKSKYETEYLACKTPEDFKKVYSEVIKEIDKMKSDQEKHMLEDPDRGEGGY